MKNKYVFVLVMLLSILIISFGFTSIYVSRNQTTEDDDLVVVTSFYPMYIAAMNVIEDTQGVVLKNLSEPQTGCLHDFQLTPEDMKLLSTADVFIINGGGIESFMEEIAAHYPDLVVIDACEGIELLSEDDAHDFENETDHDHSHEENAHAWMSVELHRKQVENIASGLADADAKNSASFLANQKAYDAKLAELQKEQETIKEYLVDSYVAPIILLHASYEYVASDYKLEVAYCMDLDEERQVSAGEVAEIIDVIWQEQVQMIFAERLYGESMCEMIKKEIDVTVVYLDPLTRGEYNADSYLVGMKDNMERIMAAMTNELTGIK